MVEIAQCSARLQQRGLRDGYEEIAAHLQQKTGKTPSYPSVEDTDGTVQSESQQLIQRFADASEIEPEKLWLLEYWNSVMLPAMNAQTDALKKAEKRIGELEAELAARPKNL